MHNIIKLYLFFEVAWFISLNSGYVYRTKFGRCEKGCLSLWIRDGGGKNDRNYLHCKYESNDAESIPCSILDNEEEWIAGKGSEVLLKRRSTSMECDLWYTSFGWTWICPVLVYPGWGNWDDQFGRSFFSPLYSNFTQTTNLDSHTRLAAWFT